MKSRALLFTVSLFVPLISIAECLSGKYWCEDVEITQLTVQRNGTALIQTSGTESNLSCIPISNHYLRLTDIDNDAKAIFSTLLTAQTSKQKVQIVMSNTPNSECNVDYIRLPG